MLFRHGDANVMAQVLPALDGPQFARLFGPATAICFAPDPQWAPEAGDLVAPRPENPPPAAAGPLRLGEDVMERMDGLRIQSRRNSIAAYLKDVAPELTTATDGAVM